jgi:xylulokinase/glycerol kinase
LLAIPDFLIFFITGRFVTDTTYGSRSLLMNLATLRWDEDLLQLFDIDSAKLSEIVEPGSIVGFSSESFQTLTELKSGTPIVSAGGDQQCAALGAGTVEEARIQINTGTGSFLLAWSDSLRLHPKMAVTCGCSAIPGKFVLEASILTTAAIYRWFKQEFYRDGDYESINQDVAASPIGANGLLLLPYFQGRGSPDWNSQSRGAFFNLTLGSTKADMARAILEGIAAEIAESLKMLEEMIGKTCEISVAGGLTQALIFNQIQADMYGRKVHLADGEATLFGTWISAAVGVGIYGDHKSARAAGTYGHGASIVVPIAANMARYQELKKQKEEIYEVLFSSVYPGNPTEQRR